MHKRSTLTLTLTLLGITGALLGCGGGGGGDTAPTPTPTPTPAVGGLVPGVSHNWTGMPTTPDAGRISVGFAFTPSTSITITELGYYDDGGDGLLIDHPVTIFDAAGTTRIAEVTVRAGAVDTLRGKFRFRAITPVTLTAGTTYVIAGYQDSSADIMGYGNFESSITGIAIDPRVSIANDAAPYRYYVGGESVSPLPFPTSTIGYDVYVGPAFYAP